MLKLSARWRARTPPTPSPHPNPRPRPSIYPRSRPNPPSRLHLQLHSTFAPTVLSSPLRLHSTFTLSLSLTLPSPSPSPCPYHYLDLTLTPPHCPLPFQAASASSLKPLRNPLSPRSSQELQCTLERHTPPDAAPDAAPGAASGATPDAAPGGNLVALPLDASPDAPLGGDFAAAHPGGGSSNAASVHTALHGRRGWSVSERARVRRRVHSNPESFSVLGATLLAQVSE